MTDTTTTSRDGGTSSAASRLASFTEALCAGGRERAEALVEHAALHTDGRTAVMANVILRRELGIEEGVSDSESWVLYEMSYSMRTREDAVAAIELLGSPLGRAVRSLVVRDQGMRSPYNNAWGGDVYAMEDLASEVRSMASGTVEVLCALVGTGNDAWSVNRHEVAREAQRIARHLDPAGVEILCGILPHWDGRLDEAVNAAASLSAQPT